MKRQLSCGLVLAIVGCSAGATDGGGTSAVGGAGGSGANGHGGENPNGGSDIGGGFQVGGGGSTGEGGSIVNPCGTECGPTELCDGENKGIDDNCDGDVDEGCPCQAGQASSCFRGDPSYLMSPGCNPGTMHCTELGSWGPCEGGNHAIDEDHDGNADCAASDPQGCHPINSVPLATVDLSTGTGTFDDNADPGSDTYTVMCPPGVMPCPAPNGTDYAPLQSGEYTVTYSKTVGGGTPLTCTFPLYVGARGLRVELSWNYQDDSNFFDAIDLDLHLHKPMNTAPWAMDGAEEDCGYGNCKAANFDPPQGGDAPKWFSDSNTPPDPVNWYDDPDPQQNTCYYAPRGAGAEWSAINMGCHSPRLDLDNISCDPDVTSTSSDEFCAPENINVDYPPKDQWMRVGVFRYPGTSTSSAAATPTVKIFCDGALAAELGPMGWSSAVQLTSGQDGSVWIVADVLFHDDGCVKGCQVKPINAGGSPLISNNSQIGPVYPPIMP